MQILPLFLFPLLFISTQSNYIPNYKYYHTLSHFYKTVSLYQKEHPSLVKIIRTFKSTQNRDIPLVVLRNFSDSTISSSSVAAESSVKRVLFVFGSHARDFVAVESALHFLKRIIESVHVDITTASATNSSREQREFSLFLLRHYSVYLLPIYNPDGRAFIEQKEDYCWLGNAHGVDLDRNFPWNFQPKNVTYTIGKRVDAIYPGPEAFSEVESKILKQILDANDFEAFVTFQSGEFRILCPFADEVSRSRKELRPAQVSRIIKIAQSMAQHNQQQQQQMDVGEGRQLLPDALNGLMMDYVAGLLKVPVVMSVSLWSPTLASPIQGNSSPESPCFEQFNPPSLHLQLTLDSMFALYVSFFNELNAKPLENAKRDKDNFTESVISLIQALLYLSIILSIVGVFLLRRNWTSVKLFFRGRRIVNTRNFGSHYFNYMKNM